MVLQHNFLFSGNILENIRLGRLDATDAEVIACVEELGCRDLIEALPEGFDTKVGERGTGLSLGQRQVICFARALLARPPASSSLMKPRPPSTPVTEARLQGGARKAAQGPHSLRYRSPVVPQFGGPIRCSCWTKVASSSGGTHTDLLSLDGTYADLYRQFSQRNGMIRGIFQVSGLRFLFTRSYLSCLGAICMDQGCGR